MKSPLNCDEQAVRPGATTRRTLRFGSEDRSFPLDSTCDRHLHTSADILHVSRLSHGVYAVTGYDVSEHHSFAQAAVRVPHGVVCLLSALVFHDLTTQSPHEVWLAIDRKARQPAEGFPPLHVVRFGGEALSAGSTLHQIDGVPVRITTPAKTVADCFKYRNKLGISVAVEALREGWTKRRFTMDELWAMARVCRMHNVIRPYVESLA